MVTVISNRQLRYAWNFVFPEENYLMYWLYYSFIFIYPIYTILTIVFIGYLDTGTIVSTDTFYAIEMFKTSHACPSWIMDLIGIALNESGYLWLVLLAHTVASTFVDIANIIDRRSDL